jgi:hypothetical protein
MKSTGATTNSTSAKPKELYHTITEGPDAVLGLQEEDKGTEVPISIDDNGKATFIYDLPDEVYWAQGLYPTNMLPTTHHGTMDARGSATAAQAGVNAVISSTMNTTTPTTIMLTTITQNRRMNDCWRQGRERSDSTSTTTTDATEDGTGGGSGNSGSERAVSTRSNSQSSIVGLYDRDDADDSIADLYTRVADHSRGGDDGLMTEMGIEDENMLTVQEISWDEETEREDRYRLKVVRPSTTIDITRVLNLIL